MVYYGVVSRGCKGSCEEVSMLNCAKKTVLLFGFGRANGFSQSEAISKRLPSSLIGIRPRHPFTVLRRCL